MRTASAKAISEPFGRPDGWFRRVRQRQERELTPADHPPSADPGACLWGVAPHRTRGPDEPPGVSPYPTEKSAGR